MAFTAQLVRERMKNVGLDAEGSDFYTDARDYIPAINSALTWSISLIDFAYAANKISEEVFSELSFTDVFETSRFSRLRIPDDVWTILAVIPKPKVINTINAAVNPVPSVHISIYQSLKRTDLLYMNSESSSATRLTVEQWENNRKNPMESGNIIVGTDGLVTYAYLSPQDYNNPVPYNNYKEIEIRPGIVENYVALRYAKNHPPISAIADSILLPNKMFDILYEKALQYIVRKQADNTTIDQVAERDINKLTQMLKFV